MSDDELMQIAYGNEANEGFSQRGSAGDIPDAFSDMSDSELESIAAQPERPWYAFDPKNMGQGFLKGLENFDKYTSAPIRKFVTENVTGRELDDAPTGSEQAIMMGASDKPYAEYLGLPESMQNTWYGQISPADIYGLGLEVLQDPFIIGAAARRGLKGAARLVEKGPKRPPSPGISQSQLNKTSASGRAKNQVNINQGDMTVEQSGRAFRFKAPESLEELRNWRPRPEQGPLVGAKRLREIENTVPDLQVKPLKYHYDMLENPKSMKELKLKFENLPTDDAKKIASYNKAMLDESTEKIKSSIDDIAGGKEARGMTDAGYDFIDTVKDSYNAEKFKLGPMFQKMQAQADDLGVIASRDLIQALGENTEVGKLLIVDDAGRFTLAKNTPRSGLSKSEYSGLKDVIEDLNDGMTFKEIQRTREFLRKMVDPTNPGATSEINKTRKIMLDYLEEMSNKFDGDVRDTFTRYAKNERLRENVEKIIGGKIEDLDKLYTANPDRVVKKIFSNPNHTELIREYVGNEKFNEMLGAFIKSGYDRSFDSVRGFSPSKFRNWLKSNRNVLDANLEPEMIARLEALSDHGYLATRFLGEVNPSGTAASLKEMLEPGTFSQKVKREGLTSAVITEAASKVDNVMKQRSAVKTVDEMLGGGPKTTPKPLKKKPSRVARMNKRKMRDTIVDSAAVGSGLGILGRTYDDKREALKDYRERQVKEKLKGEKKWANDGFQVLLKHVDTGEDIRFLTSNAESMFNDPKFRKILIEASNLKGGSKKVNDLLKRLKKEKGNK